MEKNACLALCNTCAQFGLCVKSAAANDNEHRRHDNDNDDGLIILPSDARLLKPYVIHRIAIATRYLLPVTRRHLPGLLTDLLESYQGLVFDHECRRLDPLGIDVWDELGVESAPCLKWFDEIDRWYETAPSLSPRKSQARKLRMLFLAISILAPKVGSRLL
jgi:hypothetical protein